jgi:uncharacterized tellurite resistance protein B-like protein
MLDSIKTFFTSRIKPESEPIPSAHALQLAAAALLLEVSRADFKMHDEELRAVTDALGTNFAFGQEDANDLLKVALAQNEDAVSLHPFVRLINDHFTVEQKRQIVEATWRVAFADRRLDKYEEAQIRKIADLLYVPHKDFIMTKLRVLESVDSGKL